MPAQYKQQQKFMGMVNALKKGDMNPSDASPELKKAADSMSDTDAKDFASTPHKGLPKRVKQEIVRKLKEYAMTLPGHHAKSAAPMDSLRSDDEMDVQETRIPQNFNVGTTQDYHTKLATTPRKKYDKTNFDPEHSGQEDLEEAGLKGIENIPSNKKLSQLSDNEKLSIIQSVGNIISFHVPDWAKGRYKFWQVISAGKVKKGKSLSGETQYFLQGKGPQKASPTYKSVKDLINGVDWDTMEMRRESVNESKDEVTPTQLVKIQSDIRKINPKIRVYISKHPVTIGKLQIQLGSSHPSVKGDDREIHQIYKVLKKHTGDWRTGTMFVESVNEASFHALNNPRMKKSLSNLVKDKKVQNPETGKNVALQTALSNNDHPAHDRAVSIKQSLLQRLKGMMKNEYGSVATDNFLLPSQEDKLDGTPKPKKAIGESLDFNEREMVVGIIDILKQVDDKENRKRIALNMIKKFKEEGIEFDYQKFLNHLKEYSMGSYEYNEGKTTQISEAMFVMMRDIAQDILPKDVFQRAVSPQGKEELESIMSDLKNTLNKFFKMHKINKIVK